jgi:hypothetical protein
VFIEDERGFVGLFGGGAAGLFAEVEIGAGAVGAAFD